jgi:hypothetical protein
MILRPSPISSTYFTYAPETKTFATEASDLPRGFDINRVYDDAIDEGFTIVSKRTGKEVVFRKERLVKDTEGDIQAWEFSSVTILGFKAMIFND